MSFQTRIRERICLFARSLYERGMTHGSTGNISVRLEDGSLLVTPTGSSFGFLDPAEIALITAEGRHVSGANPTKEMPLHNAFYQLRSEKAGAVVHLHSHHAVALSVLDGIDPNNVLPPLTPYSLMQLGHVRLVPYFIPGDPALGQALAALPEATSAAILANHGPIVAGATLEKAVFAIEELEASARLALETANGNSRLLTRRQIEQLVAAFNLEI